MKSRLINDRYHLVVPDHVAEWDAPSNWERERMESIIERLGPEDVLLDVGVEHGWISGLYAAYTRCRMALLEPSPEFWGNIRRVWEHNYLPDPLLCIEAFAGVETTNGKQWSSKWPSTTSGAECGAMAYRYLHKPSDAKAIPTVRIDDLPLIPTAITIDIEGAELLALQGAQHTLDTHRPLVWVSIHPDLMERDYDARGIDVIHYMEQRNYSHRLLAIDHEEHWLFQPDF